MVRAFFAALFAIVFSCTAAAQIPIITPIFPAGVPPAQTGNADNIKTVAVLSGIGMHMTLENVHFFSVTGAKSKPLDISEWKIDDQADAMVRQLLGSRFMFKEVTYDRAALAAIPNGALNNSRSAVRQFLQNTDRRDLDAFIVIRPDREMGMPGDEGLSLVTDRGPPVLFANYEIDLIDARTLETVASAYSRVLPRQGLKASPAGMVARAPGLELSDELNPNAAQQAQIKAGLYSLIPASLIATLRELKLSNAIPPAGTRTVIALPPSQDPFTNIKTVAIASAVGDTLSFERFGSLFASGSTTQLRITDWKFDEKLEEQMRASLHDRFVIKDVPVDREKLAGARLLDEKGNLNPNIAGLNATDDVDAYIVLVKNPPGTVGGRGIGIGVLHNPSMAGTVTQIFAHYALALVSAKDLKIIAARRITASPKYPSAVPNVTVENSVWPEKPTTLSPDQQSRMREVLAEILADSLDETLLQTGLNGKMIADSWNVTSALAQ